MLSTLSHRWGGGLLFLALLGVAVLINRFAPHVRTRVRRAFALFAFFALLEITGAALTALGAKDWAKGFDVAGNLFGAYTAINLVAIVVFDLILPALRIPFVRITADILVGVGYVVATFAGMRSGGMELTGVLTTSAIVSGVLALSLQATLGNILGGMALQLDGSIHVGDWVQLENGKQGKVIAIRWRHTVLETRDWDTLIVPNASLLASQIQILGKKLGEHVVQHRMGFHFNVDYRFSPGQIIDVVNEALRTSPIEGVARSPSPHCLLQDMARDGRDSFGFYIVRYWLLDIERDDRVQSLVRTRVFTALKRAGIPLARPVSTLFYAPLPEREMVRSDELRSKRLDALTRVQLFANLPEEERDLLANELLYAPFQRGEIIARPGTDTHWLYILTAGRVTIRTESPEGHSHTVSTIEAPDFFGEIPLETDDNRPAEVVALTDVESYRLDKPSFQRIMQTQPRMVEQISRTIAQRRAELMAAREGLDARSQRLREASEQRQLLDRIRNFFGLAE